MLNVEIVFFKKKMQTLYNLCCISNLYPRAACIFYFDKNFRIRSNSSNKTFTGEALMEETLTIRLALQMAREAGWRKIAILSDCKTATDQIKSNNVHDGIIATILEDIEDLTQGFE